MSSFGWLNVSLDDFTSLLADDEFKEEPVPMESFLYDKYYMGLKFLSEKQIRLVTVMSQIYKQPTFEKLYGPEEGKRLYEQDTFHEIVAQLGKGSGKDFCCRLAFCRAVYLLHCLKDPLDYYNKAHGTYVDLLNIAVNADQAQNVFFEPLKNLMIRSPWFQEMGFNARNKQVEFDQAPVRLFSGNSEAEAWEGLDLMLVCLDEIAAFKTEGQLKGENKNRLSAKAIYDMAANSVASRFPEVGKVILLSFPRYKGDFIQQRYEASEREPQVFRMKAKTWEVNPTITRAQLEPQYRRNPVEAKSRFEADPPEMIDAFFRDPEKVRQCFIGQWITVDEGTSNEETRLLEIPELFPLDEFGRLKPWFKCNNEYTRYIHVDLAQKRDRAALAMVHIPGTRKIEVNYGVWEQLPVIKMELIKWWEAMPGKEIDFGSIREFITLLCRKFPVGLVTFDRWNSIDMIQSLQRRGIRSDTHSVKVSDYDTLATAFYDSRFSGYFVDLLVEQELLKLQLLPTGKVDHPDLGSSDLSDALAGAVWNACSYAELDQEIDLEILGLEDDWEEYERMEAEEEDKRNKLINDKRTQRVFKQTELDVFHIEAI